MNENLRLIKEIVEGMKSSNFGSGSVYEKDKQCIKKMFDSLGTGSTPYSKVYTEEEIYILLTVIDSTYSTQMTKRYYGTVELAKVLYTLNTKKPLCQLFTDFLKDKNFEVFSIPGKDTNLFTENYGIDKNGTDKGKAVSLITKFAYFVTDFQFPIYDSIVTELYKPFWTFCGFSEKPLPIKKYDVPSLITAIDAFIAKLEKEGIHIDYDTFDQLLWRTGKICRENFSLILSMEQYIDYKREKTPLTEVLKNDQTMLKFLTLASHICPLYKKYKNKTNK